MRDAQRESIAPTQPANIVVPAEMERQRIASVAEAEAERTRRVKRSKAEGLSESAAADDKITVWENGANENGKNTTANFLAGMVGALPPLHELTRNASVRMPEFLGSMQDEDANPATTAANGEAVEPTITS